MQAPAHELHVSALGVPIRVSITGDRAAELAAALEVAWVWCVREPADDPPVTIATSLGGGVPIDGLDVHGSDLDVVMETITSLVTMRALESRRGELVLLHANALAHPHSGRAVVMVGPSTAGKTTAAKTLAAGRCYLTDEAVGVTADLEIVPYPKPLSVRAPGGRRQVSPAELRAALPPASPCVVARVILLKRDPDHDGGPSVADVPTLDALARVASETSYLADVKEPLHRLAAVFNGSAGVLEVRYREASDLEGLLTSLLD